MFHIRPSRVLRHTAAAAACGALLLPAALAVSAHADSTAAPHSVSGDSKDPGKSATDAMDKLLDSTKPGGKPDHDADNHKPGNLGNTLQGMLGGDGGKDKRDNDKKSTDNDPARGDGDSNDSTTNSAPDSNTGTTDSDASADDTPPPSDSNKNGLTANTEVTKDQVAEFGTYVGTFLKNLETAMQKD
ncbi:hypothetical protein [Nocardia terpenica]|uniref:Uncharacterized protein n=1 Tax=Nocardia terpenica TaxID=455432 RepID=A0A6G9ZC86_9NOCA|nr:hypothetical protein [Nocardia terpenica]QIS23040.1 hypothetical protein F6W96_36560 [Nocardia terpenica]